ncbi:MAG: hypothetical protein L3J29_04795 [Cyclobacteriaceae bacterium]|nr:hypothetical protein [Cyclobacteriaceae bacterium]
MNNTGFLRQAGAFLLTFILGTLSMHGILNYLVSDAGDLLNDGNFVPIIIFLIAYAVTPLAILAIWRYCYIHRQVKKHFNLNSSFISWFFRIELASGTFLLLAVIIYSIYIVNFFALNDDYDPLLKVAIWITFAGLIGIIALKILVLWVNFRHQEAILLKKPCKHSPEYSAIKNSRIEIILLITLWIVAFWSFIVPPAHNVVFTEIGEHITIKVDSNMKPQLKLLKKIGEFQSVNNSVVRLMTALPENTSAENEFESIEAELLAIDNSLFNTFGKVDTVSIDSAISKLMSFGKKIPEYKFNHNQRVKFLLKLNEIEYRASAIKIQHQKNVEKELYNILEHVQPFYKLLIAILLLYAIINWFVLCHINRLIKFNHWGAEEPNDLPEIEFSNFYIMLLLVMLAPIFKTIEQKDIQFNKPLWTFGATSVYNITNNKSVPEPTLLSFTINIDSSKIDTKKLQNELILLINAVDEKEGRIPKNYKSTLDSIIEKIDSIQQGVNLIDKDLKHIKKL